MSFGASIAGRAAIALTFRILGAITSGAPEVAAELPAAQEIQAVLSTSQAAQNVESWVGTGQQIYGQVQQGFNPAQSVSGSQTVIVSNVSPATVTDGPVTVHPGHDASDAGDGMDQLQDHEGDVQRGAGDAIKDTGEAYENASAELAGKISDLNELAAGNASPEQMLNGLSDVMDSEETALGARQDFVGAQMAADPELASDPDNVFNAENRAQMIESEAINAQDRADLNESPLAGGPADEDGVWRPEEGMGLPQEYSDRLDAINAQDAGFGYPELEDAVPDGDEVADGDEVPDDDEAADEDSGGDDDDEDSGDDDDDDSDMDDS